MLPNNRALEGHIKQLDGSFQETRQTATAREVEAFARENPRFDELSESIAKLLSTGMATTLPEAYGMAERLNPASQPAASTPPASPAKPDPEAQTLKASKSVTGAPSSGSNPASRKPSSSTRDSIDWAFAQTGAG